MTDDLNLAIAQLNDALAVTANMALRQEARAKEHEEWIRANEQATARHREWLAEHEAAMREHEAAMRELDRKLDRLTDLVLKGHSGNGDSG